MSKFSVSIDELVKLWDFRQENGRVRCFETGQWINRRYRDNYMIYSHILPKSTFPRYRLCDWNIMIVTPDAHTMFESFAEKAPNQYRLYKKLVALHRTKQLTPCQNGLLLTQIKY